MKRVKTRRSKPINSLEIIGQVGDRLRAKYGEVRYLETTFHDGRHWTVKADWERLIDGRWLVVELDIENY